MNVSNIEFSTPRKLDGSTYTCQLYHKNNNNTKSNVCILFNKVQIISNDNNTLILKSSKKDDMQNIMFDLNAYIIENVKNNYQHWFVSNMNPEYIEEYYSNTLIYNKEHGDLIKLKCISGNELINPKDNTKYDIEIIFKNLRFYKQKFVLECTIKNCEESNTKYELINDNESIQESDNDDEMMPEPEPEELLLIKNSYIKKIKSINKNINNNIKELQDKKNLLINLMAELQISEQYSEIVSICEQIENKCE
jgi:hypothetical protein